MCDTLDGRKKFVFERLIPALHHVLLRRSPVQFPKWQGNCCMQTAVIIAEYMRRYEPTYDWHVFEGLWQGVVGGTVRTFNHGWVWGGKPDGSGLFIDGAHRRDFRLWADTDKNERPVEVRGKVWNELGRQEYDLSVALTVSEYFTGLIGIDLFEEVLEIALSTRELTEAKFEAIRPLMLDQY